MDAEIFDKDGNMSDDSYLCFMTALRAKVGNSPKRSQKSLATEIGITAGHMNRIFKERDGLRAPYNLQLKIVEALGFKHRDFLDLGRRLLNGSIEEQDKQQQSRQPSWPNDYMSFVDVIAVTRNLQNQLNELVSEFGKTSAAIQDNYRKVDDRMEFWRGVANHLPISMCIIREGIVIWQNRNSVKWGVATGKPLCLNCIDQDCSRNNGVCAIKEAIETGTERSEIKSVDGYHYRVDAYPIISEAYEYTIVTAARIEVEDHEE